MTRTIYQTDPQGYYTGTSRAVAPRDAVPFGWVRTAPPTPPAGEHVRWRQGAWETTPDGPTPPDLDAARTKARAAVKGLIEDTDARATGRYSQAERTTWDIQRDEADAVLARQAAGTWDAADAPSVAPFLLAIEEGNTSLVLQRATDVRARADEFSYLGAYVIGLRERTEAAIAAAPTVEAVGAAVAEAAVELEAVLP